MFFHLLVPMLKFLPDFKLYVAGDDHIYFAGLLRKIVEKVAGGQVKLAAICLLLRWKRHTPFF